MEPMTAEQREKALFEIIAWALEELEKVEAESNAEDDIGLLPGTVVVSH